MYESEGNGEILEEELAVILEIMLGVEEVELSALFLARKRPDTGTITYGKTPFLFVMISFFSLPFALFIQLYHK